MSNLPLSWCIYTTSKKFVSFFLFGRCNHRPIVFIRFNPDDYIENGNTIKSCWVINNKGLSVIKKSKKEEWANRLEALQNQIDYWINPENKINKIIEVIQLFYN
jgi:hypothetical protein